MRNRDLIIVFVHFCSLSHIRGRLCYTRNNLLTNPKLGALAENPVILGFLLSPTLDSPICRPLNPKLVSVNEVQPKMDLPPKKWQEVSSILR